MRFLRLSLAQIFLLVALAALICSLIVVVIKFDDVNGNMPPIAVSPDGTLLSSGISFRPMQSFKHPVVVNDLADPTSESRAFEHHTWMIEGVAFSPDGTTLYSVADNTLRGWDTRTGNEKLLIDTKSNVNSALAVSSNGSLVAMANDRVLRVWDVATHEVVATLTVPKGSNAPSEVAFSPDGSKLVSTGWGDRTADIWSTDSWTFERSLDVYSKTLAFLPDGTLVAPGPTWVLGKKLPVNVGIYDTATGKRRGKTELESYAVVSSVATSRDGRYIAAAHGGDKNRDKRAITIWDANSLRELKTWSVRRDHDHWVDDMAFSKDGTTLYCASNYNVVSAQHWQDGTSEVIHADPKTFPWAWAIGGCGLWLLVWACVSRKNKLNELSTAKMTTDGTEVRTAIEGVVSSRN